MHFVTCESVWHVRGDLAEQPTERLYTDTDDTFNRASADSITEHTPALPTI